MARNTQTPQAERLIKKYPNRRLYDTQSSAYITLADIKQLVLDTEVFRVVDAKTGDDLTRSILLQIILEEESGGVPMFSAEALAQIIRFYGHAMQGVMGTFLEKNIQVLMDIQDRMAEQSQGLYQQHFGPEAWALADEHADPGPAEHDEQLHRAKSRPVRPDAGSDAGSDALHVLGLSFSRTAARRREKEKMTVGRTKRPAPRLAVSIPFRPMAVSRRILWCYSNENHSSY